MSDAPYTPPKVWVWNKANGGRFANINRPTAGAQKEVTLKVGKHPLQLYLRWRRRTGSRLRSCSRSYWRPGIRARNMTPG